MSTSNHTTPDTPSEYKPAQMAAEYFKTPPSADDPAAVALAELFLSVLRDSPQSSQLAAAVYQACVKAWRATKRTLNLQSDADLARHHHIADQHEALFNALLRELDPDGYVAREADRARYSQPTRATQTTAQGSAQSRAAERESQPAIAEIERLRHQLDALDHAPETEACRFQLETQIYRLEQETNVEADADEWDEEIAG